MILNQIAYGGSGTTPPATPWTGRPRPEDWPALPATADNTFNGLISVWDVPDGNRVALSVTAVGGFTVDWGDGSTPDTWASGATAEHQYDYADADLTAVDGGYKVALVQVTSTTPGSNWSVFSLQKRHSALTAVHESHWLDINVTGSALTTLEISKDTRVVRMAFLWGAAFGASIGTSSLASAFSNCSSLTTAPVLPAGFNQSLASAFSSCSSLTAVSGYSQASNMSNAFTNCLSLEAGALIGTRLATNYASCNLSPSALNAIYAGLADLNAYTITGVTGDGTTATYTTSKAHRIIVGQQVTITGINPAGYNVTAGVVTAINGDTFSVACTETGAYTSGGAIAATNGRVVTVTGNWGVSGDDPTIATLKNWTVTG